METQKAWTFDSATLKKIGKSCLLALAGCLLSFLTTNLMQILGSAGIPADYQTGLAALFMVIINAANEYVKGSNQNK